MNWIDEVKKDITVFTQGIKEKKEILERMNGELMNWIDEVKAGKIYCLGNKD